MTQLDNIVIVSAVRTAIGSFGGTLKDFQSPNLAANVMKAAIDRVGIHNLFTQVDDVRFGCCVEDNRFMNVARIAALRASIPKEVPAVT
ncbi:MAG: acetyl-CoA C-acyltransferase, partial [Candidatus Hodarchaeota archaeon]